MSTEVVLRGAPRRLDLERYVVLAGISLAVFVSNGLPFVQWFLDERAWPIVSPRPLASVQQGAAYALLACLSLGLGLAWGLLPGEHGRSPGLRRQDVEGVATAFTLLSIGGLGVTVSLTGYGYANYVAHASDYQFLISLRYVAFVALGMVLSMTGRLTRWQWTMLGTLAAFNVVTQTKSTILDLFWVAIFPATLQRGKRGLALLLASVPLILIGTVLTAELRAREQGVNDPSIVEEYQYFASSIIVECVERFEQGRGQFTLGGRLLALLLPGVVRSALGVSVSVSELNGRESVSSELYAYYDIGSAAIPTYGGGFSSIGELYLNFGWWALLVLLGLGWGLGRLWSGFLAGRTGASPWFGVAPVVTAAFLSSLRNDIPVHAKMAVQAMVTGVGFLVLLRLLAPRRAVPLREEP